MEIHKCDECGTILNLGIAIEVSFGFGTIFDGRRLEFCCINCALNYFKALKEEEQCKKLK